MEMLLKILLKFLIIWWTNGFSYIAIQNFRFSSKFKLIRLIRIRECLFVIFNHFELGESKGWYLIQMYNFSNMLLKYIYFLLLVLCEWPTQKIHLSCMWRTVHVNAANLWLTNIRRYILKKKAMTEGLQKCDVFEIMTAVWDILHKIWLTTEYWPTKQYIKELVSLIYLSLWVDRFC